MKETIANLLLGAGELHPQGDFYVGHRLPEFSFDCQYNIPLVKSSDPSRCQDSSIHPMRVVGRYMICEVHNDKVANNLQVRGGELVCQQLVSRWHDQLITGGFWEDFDYRGHVPRAWGDDGLEEEALEDIFKAVIATMVMIARPRLAGARPQEVLFILSAWPSQAEEWVQAGKSSSDVAALCSLMPSKPEWLDQEIESLAVSRQDLARATLSSSESLDAGVEGAAAARTID